MNNNELLHDIYYKKHNYDGINQLYEKARATNPDITKDDVKEWLNEQNTYQETKATVGKKEYLPIYSEVPYSFQIDLTFFPKYTAQNKGYSVLFTAINTNSRFVYAGKSKTKSMTDILNLLKDMEKKTIINSITCDKGKEF